MSRFTLLPLILLSAQVVVAESPSYPRQDGLEKGELQVPDEFRNGSASEQQVFAWAGSLILHLWPKHDELDVLRKDFDGDGSSEIAIGIPGSYGSDGGIYLYFDPTQSGFRFLGQLPNPHRSGFRCYAPSKNCYMISTSGFPYETFFQLSKVGPEKIDSISIFSIEHGGDRDPYWHLYKFPETEELLLERFEAHSE